MVFAICVTCGSICRTIAVLRFSRLYSQSSSVFAREWQIGQCIHNVHSNAECPGLRHVVHCIAFLKRVSSVVGRASCSDDMDMLWVLSNRKTLLMTSSIACPDKSIRCSVVRSGSRSPVRNISVSSSGMAERVSCRRKLWNRITNWGTVSLASWRLA